MKFPAMGPNYAKFCCGFVDLEFEVHFSEIAKACSCVTDDPFILQIAIFCLNFFLLIVLKSPLIEFLPIKSKQTLIT